MVNNKGLIKRQISGIPRMEFISRIGNIPLIESGFNTAENIYGRVKKSNVLLNWTFETTEGVISSAVDSMLPVVKLINGPLNRMDKIICKSLDIVEQRVPSVYLPPQMMYWNTKEYVSDHIVRPVLKRANSVKHIGNSLVLDNRVSTYAADRIEDAIDVVDKYVDKYLPSDDQIDGSVDAVYGAERDESHAVHTFHKGQRFSRKLKRGLTNRTFAEARALRKQSKEAIHILFYAAELIVTDPKLAVKKTQDLWTYLSGDEPENQARPANLEQLIVLLSRETARRIVHLVNFTRETIANIPKSIVLAGREVVHHFLYFTHTIFTITHMENIENRASVVTKSIISKLQLFYEEFQQYLAKALNQIALFVSEHLQREKKSKLSILIKKTKSFQNKIHY